MYVGMQGRSAGLFLFLPFTTIFLFINHSYVLGSCSQHTQSR